MGLNNIKILWKLSKIEFMNLIRSTKMIILALFVIFLNIQIITPLRELSASIESDISIFEPFVALGNSGVIVLILPLFFITMMADYPREGNCQYFYQIRCSKRIWVTGQIIHAVGAAMALTIFVFAASVLLSLSFADYKSDYSFAVTRYVSVFPERSGEYVVRLIPENLYNHISLIAVVVHIMLLLVLYFIMLALIILIFSLINKKLLGLLIDGFIIIMGAITCATGTSYMWFFPMAHTITWIHFAEYQSKEIFLLSDSYIYFTVINLILIILSISMSRRYSLK